MKLKVLNLKHEVKNIGRVRLIEDSREESDEPGKKESNNISWRLSEENKMSCNG
jgi:hypothetical protein